MEEWLASLPWLAPTADQPPARAGWLGPGEAAGRGRPRAPAAAGAAGESVLVAALGLRGGPVRGPAPAWRRRRVSCACWGDAGTGTRNRAPGGGCRRGLRRARLRRGRDSRNNFYPEDPQPRRPPAAEPFPEPYAPLLVPALLHGAGQPTTEARPWTASGRLSSWRSLGPGGCRDTTTPSRARWRIFRAGHQRAYTGRCWAGRVSRSAGCRRGWSSQAPWKIVLGHHPYRSNGRHGDRGRGVPGLGFWVEDFLRQRPRAGRPHLSGHEHSRQWLQAQCGVEWIVSGGGSKTTPIIAPERNPVHYQDGESPGFFWMSIGPDTLEGAFYNHQGELDFRRRLERT